MLSSLRRAPSRRNEEGAEEEEEESARESPNGEQDSTPAAGLADPLAEDDPDDPRVRAKKAKMELMWQRLNGGAAKPAPASAAAGGGGSAVARGSAAAAGVDLAALCRAPAPRRTSTGGDQVTFQPLT